jgi:3'(2'), 5'-bisphosphate nucleotidase
VFDSCFELRRAEGWKDNVVSRHPGREPVTRAQVDELTSITWRAAAAILKLNPTACSRRLKSDHSPVCTADMVAQRTIIEGLSRVLPGVPVVSEEAAARTASLGDMFALVDPVDGTREFLAGRPEYTVNVAVIVRGQPVVGVIAAPALGTIWRGVVGRGAERLQVPTDGREPDWADAVPIATRPWPAAGIVVAVSRSHFEGRTAAFLSRFAVAGRIDSGSSLKFCRVAEGDADLYPRLAPICEWDIAAGHAVLAAAGGRVVTPDGGAIVYGDIDNDFRLKGFIAFGDPSASADVVEPVPHLA